MLKAERDAQSRESVYCNSDEERRERCGIVKWIDAVLSGALQARYEHQAREKLGLKNPGEIGLPEVGNPYMMDDGLGPMES